MVQAVVNPAVVVLVVEWQDSQDVLPTGTWMVVSSVTSGVPLVFWKLEPYAWHWAQPPLMPLWFIVQAWKPPGVVLLWQLSQTALVGIWVAGLPITTVVPTDAPVWQVSQPVVMPLWFIVQVVKPPGVVVLVWQEMQSSEVVMWLAMLALFLGVVGVDPENVCPLWQLEQFDVMPLWFMVQTLKPPGSVASVWQELQSSVVVMWLEVLVLLMGGLGVDPWNVCPVWQLLQPEVMPA